MADFAKPQKTAEQQADTQKESRNAKGATTRETTAPRSFFSLSDVRVHYNSEKPARIGALAYTQDTQVYIAPGQRQVLRHELGHVIQQKRGPIPVRKRLGGFSVNDDPALEAEADRLGALPFPRIESAQSSMATGGVAQCLWMNAAAIRAYAVTKGFNELPDDLVTELVSFVNRTVGNGGWFKFPPLTSLDPFFEQLKRKQTELNNQAEFQAYLTNATTVIGDMQNLWDMKLNPSPLDKREGDTVSSVYGVDYTITGGKIISMLNTEQAMEYFALNAILRDYCQPEDTAKVIEGAAINVKKDTTLLGFNSRDEAPQRAVSLFMNRLRLMTKYIQQVGNQKEGKDVIKDKYWIKSTGSDPHEDGHHALFLIERINPKNQRLYKPHSLMFENAIMGGGGVVDFIRSSDSKESLPTMGFHPDEHTEDFVTRIGDYNEPLTTEDQVKKSFKKLGALEAVMKVVGVTDLHSENVLFTEKGPIPIDAECGASFGSTGIAENGGPGNVDEFDDFLNPSALYLQETASSKKMQLLRKRYQADFDAGRQAMEGNIYNRQSAILWNLGEHLKSVDSCRILPLSTSELASNLEMYVESGDAKEIAKTSFDIATKRLQAKQMAYYQKGMTVAFKEAAYIKQFAKALTAGTLPAFTFQFRDSGTAHAGAILLDSVVIGQVKLPNNKKSDETRDMTAYELRNNYITKAGGVIKNYALNAPLGPPTANSKKFLTSQQKGKGKAGKKHKGKAGKKKHK